MLCNLSSGLPEPDFPPRCVLQVSKLTKNEVLMVNIGSLSTGGRVTAVKMDLAKITLTQPVCTEVRDTGETALPKRWSAVNKGRSHQTHHAIPGLDYAPVHPHVRAHIFGAPH